MTAVPAIGSAITRKVATMSSISGTCNSPPMPTTSVGMPRLSSSAASGAESSLRRTRIAVVGGASPAVSAAR